MTASSPIDFPLSTWLDPHSGDRFGHAELMQSLSRQRVVLLGETHTRYDIHRWQLHVAAGLMAHRPIAMGFEMFQRRQQPVLDEWIAGGFASEEAFLEAVEWAEVWRYDAALYLPLFRFCREFQVPMLALNCYRTLVTRVGKEGWDAIPVEERDGLTPARPALPAYRAYLAGVAGPPDRPRDEASSDRFVRAQQTWDRAFACNIARAAEAPDAPLVLGIIGRGHLEYGYGTPYQLADLGIDRVSVLLPADSPYDPARQPGIADALFRLPPGSID
ncbi:ChaN family lipoprotein [Devosia sp. ZB163]|uniref:ChaN family lipoprotein n=1 Tax=Devosia sp. ZB163 TaxID=3025938 RepID=UPI0023612F31|nr:ChaN family lipoprotein [Devosia sp. ZB163]MDC9825736.1 ChaN family lipoprotein [Devosia sp. ZB163]